jgi:transcription initiation factor TFIID subunit 5
LKFYSIANKTKIFYGLLKEPELQSVINEEEEAEDDLDKPKKKKSKKDALQKNKKNDPNAPPANRIPLPEL